MTRWSEEEFNELYKYFSNTWTLLTLYKRINKINPDRTFEAVTRMVRKYKTQGYKRTSEESMKKLRIGFLDIEATQLNANFGYMLSWCVKDYQKEKYNYGIITRNEIFNLDFDKRIVKELLLAIDNYDILYTHYGGDNRFDIPFIRTRAYVHNLEDYLPEYMEKIIMDTWLIARKKLRLYSNRLDVIAETLKIKDIEKTKLKPDIWVKASVGDKESLNYILKHNKIDCAVLERVYEKLKKIERPVYRSF